MKVRATCVQCGSQACEMTPVDRGSYIDVLLECKRCGSINVHVENVGDGEVEPSPKTGNSSERKPKQKSAYVVTFTGEKVLEELVKPGVVRYYPDLQEDLNFYTEVFKYS